MGDQAQVQREQFAATFVRGYYDTFDTDRRGLARLYRPQSTLTFEGDTYDGPEAITQKIVSFPFTSIKHNIITLDVQGTAAGLIILVTGHLIVDDQETPMYYCQMFHISHDGENYYVHNDAFRLVYHG